MASLFTGKSGLRHVYKELTFTQINATTGKADAILIDTVSNAARLMYLFNDTTFELALWLCHPQADSTVAANRLLWMNYPASYNLNYDLGAANLEVDPGTNIFVSKVSGTSSAGKFRLIYWG